jgi:D-alanyl-D-alanine carboxypeptidase/D-alanyl-D-alanine-endopeptidase (penicillin-binding protein 4)
MKTVYSLLLVLIPFLSYTQSGIDSVLDAYKKDKDLTHANYSFCVLEASTGKMIKEYNSELALVPASTLKIITTSAALGILGKDYTYKTTYSLLLNKDSIANIKIDGSGDPSFNSSYFYSNDSLFFAPLIKKLRSKNIKKVTTNLNVNSSCFDDKIPSNWIWGDIGNYFGAGANGLSYKDNKFSLYYTSGEPNSFAKLESIKPVYFETKMKIESKVLCSGSEDEAYVYGNPYEYTRKVSGTIPPNKKNYEVEAQMPEPFQFFKYELNEQLKKSNVSANDENILTSVNWNDGMVKSQVVYTHVSPKLEKIVYYTNTKSNNHYAESLLKTIGGVKSGKQGTTANGIEAVKNYWKDRGVDVSGLHMEDGSGLSRANTVTTKIQATILSKIYRDSVMYTAFNTSLPVAGKNGSMVNLCKGTFAENNMRAKTGYISRARGYCGYVKTKSGKELAFSVLFNNYDCSAKEMKLKIEKLLVTLVEL